MSKVSKANQPTFAQEPSWLVGWLFGWLIDVCAPMEVIMCGGGSKRKNGLVIGVEMETDESDVSSPP